MKKVFSLLLCFVLTLGCSFNCFAAEKAGEIKSNNLPHNGAEHFVVEVRGDDDENKERLSEFVTVYGYDYTKGSLKSGSWRNGTSGGSSTSSATLTFNHRQDTTYNTSFTASVSGSYTNGSTIGSPKGAHYLIKYRPQYYTYTVVETKYMERYNPALGGMERYVVGTNTCYVDVFSHWDFTHVSN